MGGYVENPPPPEAPEYSPENAFDVQSFANGIGEELAKLKAPGFSGEALSDAIADGLLKVLHWAMITNPALAPFALVAGGDPTTLLTNLSKIIFEVLVKVVGAIVQPGMDVLGDATKIYVGQFVTQQTEIRRGEAGAHPSGLKAPAAGMFDSILAPMAGLIGAANPATAGAGEINSQYALGSIISIHLSTWMINILSNITGLGVLKFINSFDDVITSGLNSRSLGRVAMRPYLTKFMADPLTRDLNTRLPLNKLSSASLIKSYIRGSLTREGLVQGMRGLGFDEGVTEQVLVDTVKHLGLDELVWLVNRGAWTKEMAWDDLKQQGYPEPYAPVIFEYAQSALQRSIWHGIASDLVSLIVDHRMDPADAQAILRNSELTDDEVHAYLTRAAIQLETPKRISYSQLKQLYAESLIDLDAVLTWLQDEQYSSQDADLLVLLEFTKHEDRVQRQKDLAERRRVADEESRKAKVLRDLDQAARAAKYGIPWPPR